MKYGKHDFTPIGKFDKRKIKSIANLNLLSHTELKMWDEHFTKCFNEIPDTFYKHSDFYAAMNECEDDLFLCDNGKVYCPCEHELMEFIGYR